MGRKTGRGGVRRGIAFALAFAAGAEAAVTGFRSQQLSDGQGGGMTPGFAFQGDHLGRTLAVGDFNGDGKDDLAVAEFESFLLQEEGAVRVIFASSDGLLRGVTLPPQLITDFVTPSLAGDREIGDDFGVALAAGDFNCDGRDDLAIGIPGEDVGGQPDAGAVLVLYGSAIGLVTANFGGFEPQRFTEGMTAVGGAAETNDRFGTVLASGNFDGVEGDDLAIGVPGEDGERGRIAVLYSAASCGRLGIAAPQSFDQDSSGILDLREPGDRFGAVLASGDFRGDGADDLAIGVIGEDLSGTADVGAVAVLYGQTFTGLGAAGNQLWDEALADAGGFDETDDRFGSALATGDLDGDGRDELAIGAPGEDVSFHPDAGAVTVLHGSATTGLTSSGSEYLDQSIVLDGETLGDGDVFGFALAIGDFVDGPHRGNDLAVGIPQEFVDVPGSTYPFEGAMTLVPGGGSMLDTGVAVLWSKGFFGSAGALVGGPEFYGFALAGGDFDGNGHDDLVVGAILVEQLDPADNSVTSGAVYALYGSIFADGFQTGGVARWSGSSGCPSCLGEAEDPAGR